MGNLRAALESVPYALAILVFCLFIGTVFGITSQFGDLFSWCGLLALAFVVFGLIAK